MLSEHQLNQAAKELCRLRGWSVKTHFSKAKTEIQALQEIYLAIALAIRDNSNPSTSLEK